MDPVRPEKVEEFPPRLEREGRRGLRRIAQYGREGENPVVREREQNVRPAASGSQAWNSLSRSGSEGSAGPELIGTARWLYGPLSFSLCRRYTGPAGMELAAVLV